MQVSAFPDGGYVVHKIPFNKRLYSAWFDQAGKLTDCAHSAQAGGGSIPDRCTTLRSELQRIGSRYKPLTLASQANSIPDHTHRG